MAGQGGEKEGRSLGDPLVILSAVAIVYFSCWAIWSLFHAQISMAYVYIRYLQIYLLHAIGMVTQVWPFTMASRWVMEMCEPRSFFSLCYHDFRSMTWKDLAESTVWFNYLSLVAIIFLCIRFFLTVERTHPRLNFKKTHNIKTFVKESKVLYPHLDMFSRLNLIDESLTDPRFGMSLTARQFAARHGLIVDWKDDGDGSFTPMIDRQKATEVFRRQLGKPWSEINALSVGETLLFAISMPRVAATDASIDDKTFKATVKDSDDMVAWCWKQFRDAANAQLPPEKGGPEDPFAWLIPEIDLTYPRQIIDRYIGKKPVANILAGHAYVTTALYTLFMQARRLGVLPPADMRWMRFFDRDLWYVLDTIGRQSGFAEASASLSHFNYEIKSRQALSEAQLDKAVNALETAVTAYKYLESDKEAYKLGNLDALEKPMDESGWANQAKLEREERGS